jgi:hypothetical protein
MAEPLQIHPTAGEMDSQQARFAAKKLTPKM